MKNLILLAALALGLLSLQSCGETPRQFTEGFVNTLGKGVEFIGQQPKHIVRTVLGIDKDKRDSERGDLRLQEQLDELSLAVSDLYAQVDVSGINQDALEQEIALAVQRLAELESNDSIVEFIDPCGDNVGKFDEVLMVTSSGSIVAYFESGNKRFLTVLPNGNYRTTDVQACRFSIIGGEYVE